MFQNERWTLEGKGPRAFALNAQVITPASSEAKQDVSRTNNHRLTPRAARSKATTTTTTKGLTRMLLHAKSRTPAHIQEGSINQTDAAINSYKKIQENSYIKKVAVQEMALSKEYSAIDLFSISVHSTPQLINRAHYY